MYKIITLRIIFLLSGIFLISASYAQRLPRFKDSLTLNNQRTWYRADGSRFTKENENCPYGMELVFYKTNTVIQYLCDKGAWKKIQLTYRLVNEDDNHFAELLNSQLKVVGKIEMQMLRVAGTDQYRTELTYFNIPKKEFYTLVSK